MLTTDDLLAWFQQHGLSEQARAIITCIRGPAPLSVGPYQINSVVPALWLSVRRRRSQPMDGRQSQPDPAVAIQ